MKNVPEVLTHINLAVDGRSFAGRCTELTLPPLKRITETLSLGGTDGETEVAYGMALREAGFKLISADPEVMAFFGIADDNGFNGVFRGSYKEQGGAKKAVVATLRGLLKEINPGAWTPGQKSEYTYSVSCNYYKLEIDGKVIHEIDPVNMTRIINGVDELAQERANLGI